MYQCRIPRPVGERLCGVALASPGASAHIRRMWDEPYLETCCRSALHRLVLAGPLGRPDGLKDGPCLARLAGLGLAQQRDDGRYELTAAGVARHAAEILHQRPAPATAAG